MRRTLADARHVFETGIRPTANTFTEERGRAVLEAAEGRARAMAAERAETEATEIADAIRETQRTLTEVRDEFEALSAEGAKGRIDATTYTHRMREATDRERRANAALARLDERITQLERIETDPLAYVDSLARRIPTLRENYPW